jgi:hypothetical protein
VVLVELELVQDISVNRFTSSVLIAPLTTTTQLFGA